MSEVRVAFRARNLHTSHPEALVFMLLHLACLSRFVETRPTATGLELRVRREQLLPTRRTAVNARSLTARVLTRERSLRAFFPQNVVLLRREFPPPFLFRLFDLLRHK